MFQPWSCCSKDALAPVDNGRYLASQIPGAKYLEYTEGAHSCFEGDVPKLCGEIEEFVTGKRESELPDLERVLATVLFTDIVDSTNRAVRWATIHGIACSTSTIGWRAG